MVISSLNLGFGGGCNWGARFARGRYLVFLNDDTVVEPDWLRALVEVAAHDPRIGAVGSRLLDPVGPSRRRGRSSGAMPRPTRWGAGCRPAPRPTTPSGMSTTAQAAVSSSGGRPGRRLVASTRRTSPPTTRTSTSASPCARGGIGPSTRPGLGSSTTGAAAWRGGAHPHRAAQRCPLHRQVGRGPEGLRSPAARSAVGQRGGSRHRQGEPAPSSPAPAARAGSEAGATSDRGGSAPGAGAGAPGCRGDRERRAAEPAPGARPAGEAAPPAGDALHQ